MTFTPKSISGCSLWLDASDSTKITTTTGNAVQKWWDKSDSGYDFSQATTSKMPVLTADESLNGKKTIAFTAANANYLVGNTDANDFFVGTNCFALFAVCKFNSGTVNGSVICKASYAQIVAGRLNLFKDSRGLFSFLAHSSSSYVPQITYNLNGYCTISLICNRVEGVDTLYINGTSVYSLAYSSDVATNLINEFSYIIGGFNDSTGGVNPPAANYYLDGNIAEIITYTRNADISQVDQQKIEDYLSYKWYPYEEGIVINNSDVTQVWDMCSNLVSTSAPEIGFYDILGIDLANRFVLYSNLSNGYNGLGYTGVTGSNCGIFNTSNDDIGPLFVKKGTITSNRIVTASSSATITVFPSVLPTGEVYIFTSAGTITITGISTFTVLCVGGGGFGGITSFINDSSGGGGGGAVTKNVFTTTDLISSRTITINEIGVGGSSTTNPSTYSKYTIGSTSYYAGGGGNGAYGLINSAGSGDATYGGSGGGGSYSFYNNKVYMMGANTGYGHTDSTEGHYLGKNGSRGSYFAVVGGGYGGWGGGGGGAGGDAYNVGASDYGGDGIEIFFGSNSYGTFGAGGGGGGGGNGGKGGGGNGGSPISAQGGTGTINTGSGGGGGYYAPSINNGSGGFGSGGNGGSGVIVVYVPYHL